MGLRLHQFLNTICASVIRGLVLLQERFGYYIALLPAIEIFKSSKAVALSVISAMCSYFSYVQLIFFALNLTLEMLIFEELCIFLHERFMVSMADLVFLFFLKPPLASQKCCCL